MSLTSLLPEARQLLEEQGYRGHQALCDLLRHDVAHYDWVGFYWMNDAAQTLHLGAYSGATTDHDVIPYGRGICGQVAVSGNTFEVPDVQAQDNYLSCSMDTRSEIVVPIYHDHQLIGQLDIDSHVLDPFSPEDHDVLGQICEWVAQLARPVGY